jgi:molybdenum cofactor cytidylyltransferase
MKIATLILAAGESKRMNGIKQLLPWKDSTLLEHAITQSLQSCANDVYLVLGANKDKILKAVDTRKVNIIINDDWSLGMGTSIAAVIRFIRANQLDFDGILIRLVDQPLLDVNYYNILIDKYIDSKHIIASSYKSGYGVPAIFDKIYFDELLVLKPDKGAKGVINGHKKELIVVDSEGRTIDLDDRQTYLNYYGKYGK